MKCVACALEGSLPERRQLPNAVPPVGVGLFALSYAQYLPLTRITQFLPLKAVLPRAAQHKSGPELVWKWRRTTMFCRLREVRPVVYDSSKNSSTYIAPWMQCVATLFKIVEPKEI